MRRHDADNTAPCGDANHFWPSDRDFLTCSAYYEDFTGLRTPEWLADWLKFHSRKEFFELVGRIQREAERYAASRADKF
jgi:hypothetical protein